jgi:hypothetical protein
MVYGFVNGGGESIRIEWEDGLVEEVPVVNDGYIAIRDGFAEVLSVELLDDKQVPIATPDATDFPLDMQ